MMCERKREREMSACKIHVYRVNFNFFQVTIAFWKAIGGDEDEIGDLSDLSDAEMP